MGILDGIVEWLAEQIMHGLDLISTSVLGALGCDMDVFLRYFPAAETMYKIFVALSIGLILLNWVWQLFKNFGLGAGIEAEDPVKLSIRSVLFILLAYFSDDIVSMALKIGGTPYAWIMDYGFGTSCHQLCRFQFRHAGYHRSLRQWRSCPDYPDSGDHPCMELSEASSGSCRTVCPAGRFNLYCSGCLFHGRIPVYLQYI